MLAPLSLVHTALVLKVLAIFIEVNNNNVQNSSVSNSQKYEQLPEMVAKGRLSMEERDLGSRQSGHAGQGRWESAAGGFCLQQWFSSSRDLPPKAIQQCLETFLVVTTADVLL